MTPYDLAKKEIGTFEWKDGANPKVIAYYKDAGHPEISDDAVAWCAAFVGAMIKRAGGKPSGSLAARSYLKWGTHVEPKDIREGDVIVFTRGGSSWQGHVTFATGKPSGGKIKCLGGNQADAVNIQTYSMDAFLGARRWSNNVVGKPKGGVTVEWDVDVKPITKPPVTPVQRHTDPPALGFWALLFEALRGIFTGRAK